MKMKDLWGKFFGVFFGVIALADFLSLIILYRTNNPGKVLLLKAFPVEYWAIKVGEMSAALAYIVMCFAGSCNSRKTLALLAFLFVALRLLSNVPLLGNITKITLGSLIGSVIIYIGGMATMYNLRRC
ncbi:hypothetical protein [Thermococcus sp. Bubb.Bath]|uniref:hypothetical protein n=1 Tax=Thermococcus sp. Bubb.Bath TaxID=1638242 RepID=UPI00143AFA78|nr:hypothetical protein [Thermococcus sp. Bubb.Bath]NJF25960.1 hypothetical protein [Thermococcus sp. Bubb.Bath]